MRRHVLRASLRLSSAPTTQPPPPQPNPYRTPTPSTSPRRHLSSTSSPRQTTPSQPPPNPHSTTTIAPQTHYDFFPTSIPSGPPPTGPFTLDLRALRTEFLRLQAKAHPDLHPPAHKSRAEALSSRVNEAYKTLQDPLLRAQYLLSLRGVDVAGDETGSVEDQELLMAVLEAQEGIEEATAEGDLVALREENERNVAQSVAVLEEAFAGGDWERAKAECVRLRYWVNIGQGIRDWEPGSEVRIVH